MSDLRDIATLCKEIDCLTAQVDTLRRERDEARQRTNSILTEIDCRIEHGAESNGHLEAIYNLFKENTDV
jgi:uncharacterized coiled-coil DUF342 family protein